MLLGSLLSKTTCLKLSTVLFIALFLAKPVYAQERSLAVPPQATCITPTGKKIVTYLEGIHGVPGNLAAFTGSDEVFNLGNNDALQCFCATNGTGVETIWWSSFTGLTQAEIDNFVAQGWVFVPNGSAWGLSQKPYLAKNTNFFCSPPTTTSSSPSGPSQTSTTPGDVLGIQTLAQTGGKGLITLLIFGSTAWLLLGILLRILSSKKEL